MQKTLMIAVGAGLVSAIASIAILTGMPLGVLLVYLAPLPLMMAGLALGVPAATLAGGSGIVFAVIVGGVLVGVVYAAFNVLPAWVMVRQALSQRTDAEGVVRWAPEGRVLAALALAAIAVLGGLGLFIVSAQGNISGIEASVTASLKDGMARLMPTVSAEERGQAVDMLSAFFPGTIGSSWLAMLVINGLLAQSILVRAGRNLRPAVNVPGLALPNWISWALVVAAAVAVVASGDAQYLARNGAMVLVVPFFFLGLAVVHHLARLTTFPGTAVAAVYFAMLFSRWMLMGIAGLGVVEQWVGIRRRFQGPRDGQED